MGDWKMRAMNRCEPPALPTGAPGAGEGFSPAAPAGVGSNVPPQAWFLVSAVFHYLGPAFAVLLFPAVGVLGVAWFRIASAALVFAPITRPMRLFARIERRERLLLVGMGACLALMNCSFYLALARLPISLVAAIEFVGTIGLALYGMRTPRNRVALSMAVAGVFVLINVRWSTDLVGLGWAFANGVLFVLYIVLGHRIARGGAGRGIERLGAAMAVAFVAVFPVGIMQAARAFSHPMLVLAGVGVGICSSVIPYVCDQLAMARLSRASFALMLTLLPASATIIGAIVLGQVPGPREMSGIALVMAAMALHRPAETV
jgi:inner membrane transporter RhtA